MFYALATDLGDFLCAAGVAVTVAVWAWLYFDRLAASAFVFAYLLTVAAVTGLKLVSTDYLPPLDVSAPMSLSQGAPSGHMALATVVYGAAALFCGKARRDPFGLPGLILCTSAITTVGYTRVVLGHHTVADVLAGFVLGALALIFPAIVVKARSAKVEMRLGRLLVTMVMVGAIILASGARMPSTLFL
jgi:membrane-associated phospholipid phosphatase